MACELCLPRNKKASLKKAGPVLAAQIPVFCGLGVSPEPGPCCPLIQALVGCRASSGLWGTEDVPSPTYGGWAPLTKLTEPPPRVDVEGGLWDVVLGAL